MVARHQSRDNSDRTEPPAAEVDDDARRAADQLRRGLFVQMMERHGGRVTRELQRRHRGDEATLIRAYQAALGVAVDQVTRAHNVADEIVFLVCAHGYRAVKKIVALTPEGILPFDAGMWFAVATRNVVGLAGLVAELENAQLDHRVLAIRGRLIEGRDPRCVRRLANADKKAGVEPYFVARARWWLAIDLDSFPLPPGTDPLDVRAVAEAARALLPAEFWSASCWAQLTAGAGIQRGGRCRLWFWCGRPVSDAECKRWLKDSPVDLSLYSAVQPHYCGRPIFDGCVDPAPLRSLVLAGEVDVVTVPPLPEPVRPAPAAAEPRSYCAPRRGLHFKTSRPEAYMLTCLEAIIGAEPGDRHRTFVRVATRLYGLARAGALDPRDVEARVLGAVNLSSFDRDLDEVHSALRSAGNIPRLGGCRERRLSARRGHAGR